MELCARAHRIVRFVPPQRSEIATVFDVAESPGASWHRFRDGSVHAVRGMARAAETTLLLIVARALVRQREVIEDSTPTDS